MINRFLSLNVQNPLARCPASIFKMTEAKQRFITSIRFFKPSRKLIIIMEGEHYELRKAYISNFLVGRG